VNVVVQWSRAWDDMQRASGRYDFKVDADAEAEEQDPR
jgi:hypothetical protein